MKPFPHCTVLRDAERQTYFVEPHCIDSHTGVITNWGPLIALTKEDMSQRGLELVIRELQEFPSRDSAQRSVPQNNSSDGRRDARRRRASVPVFVEMVPDGALALTPSASWSRWAWTDLADKTIRLTLPTTPSEFFRTLESAFDRCVATVDQ